MRRRRFLKLVGVTGSGALLLSGYRRNPQPTRSGREWDTHDVLRGFIVSDAHFGLQCKDQPSTDSIRKWMRHITARFPNLDVMVDTGDANHACASADDRANWTEAIGGMSGAIPLFVCCGNHDLHPGTPARDAETRCADLFNLACRPYFSFNVKNVHFVVLPELMTVNLMTMASIDWLRLDLALHADRTVIVLSHNALKGTTYHHGDPWYRQVANSDDILGLLLQWPNVIAWMHGHNHTYEIVEEFSKLFVSNGRMGGFRSKKAVYASKHTGGIYFEVRPDGLLVRGYSAAKECFLDECGYPHLSRSLAGETTVSESAPPEFSYGCGMAAAGRSFKIGNHLIGEREREIYVASSPERPLNEDPSFRISASDGTTNRGEFLAAGAVRGASPSRWACTRDGLLFQPMTQGAVILPNGRAQDNGYYQWPGGSEYKVSVEVEARDDTARIHAEWRTQFLEAANEERLRGPSWLADPGEHVFFARFAPSPARADVTPESVLCDPGAKGVSLHVETGKGTLLIRSVTVHQIASEKESDTLVFFNGLAPAPEGASGLAGVKRFTIDPPRTAEKQLVINPTVPHPVTVLVRQQVRWQVRNAFVHTDGAGAIVIGPVRNADSRRNEIVIAPLAKPERPWIHRLRNVNHARIAWDSSGTLEIALRELLGAAEIEIVTDSPPTEVREAARHTFSERNKTLTVTARGLSTIKVRF